MDSSGVSESTTPPDLEYYSRLRYAETSCMLESFAAITRRYEALVGRVCLVLGRLKPANPQDSVVRDLTADSFDFMHESRSMVLGAKVVVAYPLARRALESLSLLHLAIADEAWAARWETGEQIPNSAVRRALDSHPLGGPSVELADIYKFFSDATHPNRDTVLERFLGDGNEYSLGVVAAPERILLYEFCIQLLSMWSWFAPMLAYFYRERMEAHDPAFFAEYTSIADETPYVMAMLRADFQNLMILRRGIDFGG